jgi:hypothetical protein
LGFFVLLNKAPFDMVIRCDDNSLLDPFKTTQDKLLSGSQPRRSLLETPAVEKHFHGKFRFLVKMQHSNNEPDWFKGLLF